MTNQIGYLTLCTAAGLALFLPQYGHGGTLATLKFTIEPADVGLGEPVYLDFVASNPSMQAAEFDLNSRLRSDLRLSYRVPDSNKFEPLRLLPDTGSTVEFVGTVPAYGEVKRRFLLNMHVPITVARTYEIVGQFKADDKSGREASEIDRVFAVGPRSDSRLILMVREFAERFRASHTGQDGSSRSAVRFGFAQRNPEMLAILGSSPVYDTTIFESLANRHGTAGIEALMSVLSISNGAERRLLARGALLRRQGTTTDPDMARRLTSRNQYAAQMN